MQSEHDVVVRTEFSSAICDCPNWMILVASEGMVLISPPFQHFAYYHTCINQKMRESASNFDLQGCGLYGMLSFEQYTS